jgi:hypothetical protein
MYLKSWFIEKQVFEEKFKNISHLDFSFFFDCIPTEEEISLNPINIFAHIEPNEYFGHHDWIIQNKHLFSFILTWSDKVLNNCENAIFIPFGSSWITEDISIKHRDKKFELGHLCGDKLLSYGHSMRHELFSREKEFKIPTKFKFKGETILPAALVTKEEIFGDPMFAIVIENTSHNGYFSEKITDCMMLKTIPIYWGCSNINLFYNPNGIITFQNPDDLIRIANELTIDDYNSRKKVIEENFARVKNYQNFEQRVVDKITEIFKFNNIC